MRTPYNPKLLNSYVTEATRRHAEIGFVWGEFDCCTFAFDWIARATGRDLMADFRGLYDDRAGAAKALREIGEGDLRATLHHRIGEPITLEEAQRGDIAWHADRAVGIITSVSRWGWGAIFIGEDEIGFAASDEITEVFAI